MAESGLVWYWAWPVRVGKHGRWGGRCRACSTPERTATNIVIAPIACAHRAAPHTPAPCSCSSCSPLLMLVLPAPCSCSHCSLLALLALALLALALPAPHSCCSLLLLLTLLPLLPALRSCSRCLFSRCLLLHSCSLLGFGAALGHFRAPRVRAIPYLGFASQHLA